MTERILFVTSRALNSNINPNQSLEDVDIENVFSNRLASELYEESEETMENLRVGLAERSSGGWRVTVFPDVPLGATSPQSRQAFQALAERARLTNRPILAYVHGYNNAISDPLDAAQQMRDKYDCEVICFMWPSEGGMLGVFKYAQDRQDAELTARPFLRFLHKMKLYLASVHNQQPVLLMCHSMGNYILENAVKLDLSTRPYAHGIRQGKDVLTSSIAPFFADMILTAADVDSPNHVHKWVDQLKVQQKIFIFINKGDDVLRLSDWIAGRLFLGQDHPARLGQTLVHIEPTDGRVYVNVNVTMKNPLDLFQLFQMEHWYHRFGEGDIKVFYKAVIPGQWSPQRFRNFLDRGGSYYSVMGYSEAGRSPQSRL